MIENEMGYRGSKSVALILDTLFVSEKPSSVAVKEQRADGNWCIKKSQAMHLRCTLMGSERNFQVKILSKQRDVAKFTYVYAF